MKWGGQSWSSRLSGGWTRWKAGPRAGLPAPQIRVVWPCRIRARISETRYLGMKLTLSLAAAGGLVAAAALIAQQTKAPDPFYVPSAWHPHEGGILKFGVDVRFGQEPETMPDGWYFGRVTAVAAGPQGGVFVFHPNPKDGTVCGFGSQEK